ncbi:hypothetical protein ACH5RR_018492 [Cinchona calisaya]|uniref:Uncharacterized protein n=1 Tax=Cinchona calisaya TaxID=153742 RepID=A0ABD2ZMW0_9GENT
MSFKVLLMQNLARTLRMEGMIPQNNQARSQMKKIIVTWRTPPFQSTSLEKQPLNIFKPPTRPLPPTVSEFHLEEIISNCSREYVSMLWKNLKQQISKTSLDHMPSLNKHATRFLEKMGSKMDIATLRDQSIET